jgi:hypothetical protein
MSPSGDQIQAELIQAGHEILGPRFVSTVILFGIEKNCLIIGRNLLFYQFTKRSTKLIVIIIMGHHCYQLHTKLYRISLCQFEVHT